MGLIYASQAIATGCEFPLWMQWAGIVYGFTIIVLFANFYFQAYIKKSCDQVKSLCFLAGPFSILFFLFVTRVGTVCDWHRPCASIPCLRMWLPRVDALGAHFLCIHHPSVLHQLLLPRLCEGPAPEGNSLLWYVPWDKGWKCIIVSLTVDDCFCFCFLCVMMFLFLFLFFCVSYVFSIFVFCVSYNVSFSVSVFTCHIMFLFFVVCVISFALFCAGAGVSDFFL